MLHRVCNTHSWLGGSCGYEELPEERKLEWFLTRERKE